MFANSWSPDGGTLAFAKSPRATGWDVWLHQPGTTPRPFLDSRFNESAAAFSPDGRWIAYTSDESGRMEIYLQPYPGPRKKVRLSTDGGSEPVWNPVGNELFYRWGDRMMAVELDFEPELRPSTPRLLFAGPYARRPLFWFTNYDVHPDGRRFLMIEEDQPAAAGEIRVVLGWFTDLEQRLASADS